MAIAIDATSGSNTQSWSHTCTGSNLLLWVTVRSDNSITGVTYNSVALTKVGETTVSEHNSLWYLIAPATGAHTVAVTLGTATFSQSAAASYTGVRQSGVPDASNTSSPGVIAPPLNISVTTVADNCWVVASGQDNSGSGIVGAGTATTARIFQNNSVILLDTNGVVTPAGARTLQLTDTAGSAILSLVAASFAPVAVVVPSLHYLSLLGTGS